MSVTSLRPNLKSQVYINVLILIHDHFYSNNLSRDLYIRDSTETKQFLQAFIHGKIEEFVIFYFYLFLSYYHQEREKDRLEMTDYSCYNK